eukprot:826273-Amphidinium_carterae.1
MIPSPTKKRLGPVTRLRHAQQPHEEYLRRAAQTMNQNQGLCSVQKAANSACKRLEHDCNNPSNTNSCVNLNVHMFWSLCPERIRMRGGWPTVAKLE